MKAHVLLKFPILPILFIASFVAVGCAGAGGGNPLAPSGTVTVDQSGGGDFTTIQAAIDASSPGTTIRVGSGTYEGDCDVAKSLTIECSVSSTVIQMSGFPKVTDPAEASDTEMDLCVIRDTSDVEIRDCTFSNGPDDGIVIRNSTNITLINVTASNNGDDGLDIRNSSDIMVTGSTFSGNGDKGVRIRKGSMNVTVATSTISGNGGKGARIRGDNTSAVAIRNSTVSDNLDDGIRVEEEAAGVTLADNTIMNNVECGIRVENAPGTVFQNNTVNGNGDNAVPCPK